MHTLWHCINFKLHILSWHWYAYLVSCFHQYFTNSKLTILVVWKVRKIRQYFIVYFLCLGSFAVFFWWLSASCNIQYTVVLTNHLWVYVILWSCLLQCLAILLNFFQHSVQNFTTFKRSKSASHDPYPFQNWPHQFWIYHIIHVHIHCALNMHTHSLSQSHKSP